MALFGGGLFWNYFKHNLCGFKTRVWTVDALPTTEHKIILCELAIDGADASIIRKKLN